MLWSVFPPTHPPTFQAFIDFFAAIGWVTQRKRALGAWAKLKATKEKDLAAGKEWKGRGVVQGTPSWPGGKPKEAEQPGWEVAEKYKAQGVKAE